MRMTSPTYFQNVDFFDILSMNIVSANADF